MSERVYVPQEFELGDQVEFDGPCATDRMRGVIVRVHNTRYNYHVEVNGERYSVCLDDNMKKVD